MPGLADFTNKARGAASSLFGGKTQVRIRDIVARRAAGVSSPRWAERAKATIMGDRDAHMRTIAWMEDRLRNPKSVKELSGFMQNLERKKQMIPGVEQAAAGRIERLAPRIKQHVDRRLARLDRLSEKADAIDGYKTLAAGGGILGAGIGIKSLFGGNKEAAVSESIEIYMEKCAVKRTLMQRGKRLMRRANVLSRLSRAGAREVERTGKPGSRFFADRNVLSRNLALMAAPVVIGGAASAGRAAFGGKKDDTDE